MKLAANLLLTVFWQAFAEACSLMQPVALEPERLIDLLADSNIAAGVLKARRAALVAAFAGAPSEAASFDIDFMRKDLRDMLAEAEAAGAALPLAAQTLRCFDETSRAGFGQIDGTQYAPWWMNHSVSR